MIQLKSIVTFATAAVFGWAILGARGRAEVFTKHAVASQEAHASAVGRDVMRQGGNAIDAAVATALALAVTLPEAGNIGGGGFLVAYLADRREVVTIDFREAAPASSDPRMYLGADGKPRPRYRKGAWAAGVPGTVRGLGLAHARFGKLAWPELVKPAVRLAREGFPISSELAGALNRQLASAPADQAASRRREDFGRLGDFPESVAAFSKPDKTPWQEGDRLVQSDLAATLERIAIGGPDAFYTGKTADLIERYMVANSGFITKDDLKAYEATLRLAVHTTFRGFEVFGMGPPSSGGIVVCQMLNILERFDLKSFGSQSPRTVHLVTEAMRRAFFVRATKIGDPDFVTVATDELASKSYAETLAKTIGERATPSARLAPFPITTSENTHTTHLSTIDQSGTAVALTYTLEESYGAKCVVAGAGFLLNNEMGDFNVIPGLTDDAGRIGTPPNLIAPRKRMLSSQAPTLVLKDGRVRIVTGSPGGRTIPNTVLWVILNLVEFGLEPRAAVDAPRTHHQWFPDTLTLEGHGWTDSTRTALAGMGHKLGTSTHQGDANTIVVDPDGRIHAEADLRRKTAKAAGD